MSLLYDIYYFNHILIVPSATVCNIFPCRGNLTRSTAGPPLVLQASFLFHLRGPLADYLSLRAWINRYLSTLWKRWALLPASRVGNVYLWNDKRTHAASFARTAVAVSVLNGGSRIGRDGGCPGWRVGSPLVRGFQYASAVVTVPSPDHRRSV